MTVLHDVLRQSDPLDGPIVGVLLSNAAERVWLNADAYDALIAEVGDVALFLGKNERGLSYVRLRNPLTGQQETLARVVTGRITRSCVSYLDEDRLNLRRSNLVVRRGSGGRPKRNRTSSN